MTLRVAIQMDPIESLKLTTDSTLLLGLEAQRRGYELYYYNPEKLAWHDGKITASAYGITLYNDPAHYYDLAEPLTLYLNEMDVILLRQNPPFNMTYITNTYILEQLHPKPFVVNNPTSVRNCAEKLLPMLFRQFMPPTMVTANPDAINAFRLEHKDIVIKPLYSYSGRSVFRIKFDDTNFPVLMNMLFSENKEPWMIQRFLPEVKNGCHRIILIDGEIGGIYSADPAPGEMHTNSQYGSIDVPAELGARHIEISNTVGPFLKEHGIIFAALDIIGDYLSEINLTSPGGISANYRLYGKYLEAQIWDAIERRLTALRSTPPRP